MNSVAIHHAVVNTTATTASAFNEMNVQQLFGLLGKLTLRLAYFKIFLRPDAGFIIWNIATIGLILIIVGWIAAKFFQFRLFGGAFEKIKFKQRDINRALSESMYLEITIPKNSQATAFQVQQKILKTLHSMYADPIDGVHAFSPTWYFFQKLFRFCKVVWSKKVFFTMQIWGEYPDISFRINIPAVYYDRLEKSLYNAYPGAEINTVDKNIMFEEISRYPKNYLSYGQSTIEGKFHHRIRTFKDASSDPIDSIISTMEGLKAGQFMVYNLCLSPASHFFNQIIHFLLDEEERHQQGVFDRRIGLKQVDTQAPDILSQLRTAMIEKMKASLFQVIISYWTIMPTPEASEAKLANIQAVLTEINQKSMNTVKHRRLYTKDVGQLKESGELERIVAMQPIVKRSPIPYVPLFAYKNPGQIVSDAELYSLWHLPNLTTDTTSSLKISKFKKLPASQEMRSFGKDFFINLGTSNFKMHEDNRLGIPSWEDMKKHVYILGGTGSGKSETLKTILSNILQKHGDQKIACLIVDPKNDFATDLLTMIPEDRKNDVVYFNPTKQKDKPLSFPFFSQFSGEKTNDERIEFLISIMKRFVQIDSAYSWGPELENILRQLFATAYILPEPSLSGLDLLLHDSSQIKNMMPYLPDRLRAFWDDSILRRTNNDLAKYLATTNNKIGKLLDYPELTNIADRTETKITFEEMIATGKIFIANFGSCSEQLKKYYSVYLTAHIAEAIFGQARLSSAERKPAVFVVDEFQRVASDIFETLFSEVRAFNTALVISNQFMGQLDEKIQKSIESNIATKIFMRTQSVDDAEIAEKILGEKATVEDIINLPTGAAYIKTLVNGIPQPAMSIAIERTKHPTVNGQEIETWFVEQTMNKYGTPLDEIVTKRNAINSLYYTAKQKEKFLSVMDKRRAANAAKTAPPEEAPIEPSEAPEA
jgi:hypothetical protein